jgi:TRAP-type C4-dicarboxylate transport system permease small subunit
METEQTSSAMEIPMSWVYASVPAGCTLMAIRLIVEIVKILMLPGGEIGKSKVETPANKEVA